MESVKALDFPELFIIICGIMMGTVARLITLRIDTRQNPSFPNGYFINIVIGFFASALGAVSVPALLSKDFTAVTFLLLAVQHFREIRKEERESLQRLENSEYTKRGPAYIDGIAKTYEARNYHSLLTSLFTVTAGKIFLTASYILNATIGVAAGLAVIFILHHFTKGKRIGDLCTVRVGSIKIENSELYADGMFVTNLLGTENSRQLFLNEGVAVIVEPKNEKVRLTLNNYGQRQAMLFEATRSFGVKRYQFTRRNFKEGKIVIAFVPIIRDVEGILKTIKNTPVLESSRKISLTAAPIGGMEDE